MTLFVTRMDALVDDSKVQFIDFAVLRSVSARYLQDSVLRAAVDQKKARCNLFRSKTRYEGTSSRKG